jgi:hypothetical protein
MRNVPDVFYIKQEVLIDILLCFGILFYSVIIFAVKALFQLETVNCKLHVMIIVLLVLRLYFVFASIARLTIYGLLPSLCTFVWTKSAPLDESSTFEDEMNNSRFYQIFKEYTMDEQSSENILFFEAVRNYKHKGALEDDARAIFTAFLDAQAVYYISVNDNTRTHIVSGPKIYINCLVCSKFNWAQATLLHPYSTRPYRKPKFSCKQKYCVPL